MAGKINPYDYEPEYSDEDIGNVNVGAVPWCRTYISDTLAMHCIVG